MLNGSRVALVVNPSAGRGLAARLLPEIAGRLRDAGAALEVLLGRNFAEARHLIGQAAVERPDVLAVVGGDGMMHLGVNACTHRPADPSTGDGYRPALGLVPAGTGNDLARGLGFDVTDTLAAVDLLGRVEPTAVDATLARRSGAEVVIGSVVAAGYDALVSRRANALRWPRGSLRYTIAALTELATFRPLRYQLVIDEASRELDAMLVAVGTTSTYGGGMQICLGADPTDGLLDVTVVHPVGRGTLLRLLPRIFSGTFVRHPCVERFRAQSVQIVSVVPADDARDEPLVVYGDGEPLGPAPLTLTSLPRALRVVLPAAA